MRSMSSNERAKSGGGPDREARETMLDQRSTLSDVLMTGFADRTGLTGKVAQRRYLWTDAFALCNFLDRRDPQNQALATQLVQDVHRVLGRYPPDDQRTGWLSALPEAEGTAHPTLGGLRIGKPRPERGPDEAFDEQLEWDRDGQYFHYLTKWMHALDQQARATKQPQLNVWARAC